jgi:hypothetical protein
MEFERTYYTLAERPSSLSQYLTNLDIPAFAALCNGGSMESSLIMGLVDSLPSLLQPDRILLILNAISKVDRFDILAKFLSRREKERIKKTVADNPELAPIGELFNLH